MLVGRKKILFFIFILFLVDKLSNINDFSL